MDENADNQSYVQMFIGNTQISEVIQRNISGDYSEPLEVYEVVLQNDNFLGLLGNDKTEESISEFFEGLSLGNYQMDLVMGQGCL